MAGMEPNPYKSPDDTVNPQAATSEPPHDEDDEELDFGLAAKKAAEIMKIWCLCCAGLAVVAALLWVIVHWPF